MERLSSTPIIAGNDIRRLENGVCTVLTVAFLVPLITACGGSDDGPISYRPEDPRAQAVWDDPARCGAPSYRWLDDPTLGDVDTWFQERAVDTGAIEVLLDAAGFTIDRPFVYDTVVYRMSYVTQDRGQLKRATALLALPVMEDPPAEGLPLLAYLHGTSGFSDNCAPSVSILDQTASAALASFGYAVVAPDYLGMLSIDPPSDQLHPYLVAEATAIASLDAIRAARKLVADSEFVQPVDLQDGVLLLGGSQGGHAALMTTRYTPYYAAEETIIAVAASVPPADVVGEVARTATSWVSGTDNVAAAMTASADWYDHDVREILLPPFDTQARAVMETECGLGDLLDGATSVEEVFTPEFRAMADELFPEDGGDIACMVRSNSVVHTPLERLDNPPTIFVLSELDELVGTPLEREAFDTLCEQGLALEYLECAGVDHTTGAVGSIGEQLDFLDARRAGEPWPQERQCQRTAPVVCSGTNPTP